MLKGTVRHIKLIIMIVMVFFMIYSGANKLVAFPGWPEQFEVWGYSKTVMYVVGVVEIIIASLIFAKDTRVYGCIALALFLGGAIYTHITNYEYDQIYTAILLITGCAAVIGLDEVEKRMK